MNINYKISNFLQEHKQNLLNPDNVKNSNIMYQLVEDISRAPLLGELNSFIPNFMYYLWKQPKIICKLLLTASNKDMKESLSDLILFEYSTLLCQILLYNKPFVFSVSICHVV